MNADLHRLLVSWVEGDGLYGSGGTGTTGATWFSRDKSGSDVWTTPGSAAMGTTVTPAQFPL